MGAAATTGDVAHPAAPSPPMSAVPTAPVPSLNLSNLASASLPGEADLPTHRGSTKAAAALPGLRQPSSIGVATATAPTPVTTSVGDGPAPSAEPTMPPEPTPASPPAALPVAPPAAVPSAAASTDVAAPARSASSLHGSGRSGSSIGGGGDRRRKSSKRLARYHTEETPFPADGAEAEAEAAVLASVGAEVAAAMPRDVLVRGIRSFGDERRRNGRPLAEAAAAALGELMMWRASTMIENLAATDSAALSGGARFDELWQQAPCGEDAWGRPCVWDRLGAAQVPRLLDELTEAGVLRLFLRRLERLRQDKLARSEARGHAVYKHVYVIDLAGLSAGVLRRENRELLRRVTGELQRRYPDSLHTLYLVNAPRLFLVGWRLLQPLMDPVSWSKCVVLGSVKGDPHTRQRLLDAGVDPAFLAREAGLPVATP